MSYICYSSKKETKGLQVGHSLGGALAELDAVFFTLNLPSAITVIGRTFGTPRVGNPDWADLVDTQAWSQLSTAPLHRSLSSCS